MEGVDYAFTKPSAQALVNAGKHFAGRYIGPGTDDKHLHAAERDSLFAHGIDIFLLVEGPEDGALGGFNTGVAHAKSAETARLALGAPALPMYYAVDFDVTTTQWPTVRSYLIGAGSVTGKGRVGIYGGIDAMKWASADGVATWFFQTYAWSEGRWFAGNHVEQYENNVNIDGASCDMCRSMQANFGQWSTKPPIQESDMFFAVKEESSNAVYLSDGMGRRGGASWTEIQQMNSLGWITTPRVSAPLSIASDGFVVVVPDGHLDAYAGPLVSENHGPAPSPGNFTIRFDGTGTAQPA